MQKLIELLTFKKNDILTKKTFVISVGVFIFSMGVIVGKKYSDTQNQIQLARLDRYLSHSSTSNMTEAHSTVTPLTEPIPPPALMKEDPFQDKYNTLLKQLTQNDFSGPTLKLVDEAALVTKPKAIAAKSKPAKMKKLKVEEHAKAEEQAKLEAKAKAEEQAKLEAKAKVEEQAKLEAKAKVEEQAKLEEMQAKREAQAKLEEQAKLEAKAKADEQARADVHPKIELAKIESVNLKVEIPLTEEQERKVASVQKMAIEPAQYSVQLASDPEEQVAKQKVEELKAQGLDSFYQKVTLKESKAIVYRTFVGHFSSIEKAVEYQSSLKQTLPLANSSVIKKIKR